VEFGQVKWKFKTGGKILSSPAAAGGLVYFGSDDGFLYALEASSGIVKWRFDAEFPIRSSPAVQDGVVIFGTDQGTVYALE
jgi:eukaryotic-like serine/threonine-protein kinase